MNARHTPHKICDPIHGFIRFDAIEKKVIDARPFQRLRYIRQMGVAYLVYPGATHTRFEHSLGVMELVTRIYDSLDYFKDPYWRQILRLAALCHDIGHLPFSHTAESSLLPDGGHEKMTEKLIRSEEMREIWKEIPHQGRNVEDDIVSLSASHEIQQDTLMRLLGQIITEDNFGADRIDYLIRDAKYTGVGYGHFDYHQLIDTLRVLPKGLGISQSGLQSVESLWIARYMMYARVYHHSKSRLYTFHMHRFMKKYYESRWQEGIEWYLDQCDFHILDALQKSTDFDALAILKRGPSYEDLSDEVQENDLIALKKEFNEERVYVEIPEKREDKRDFPVKCGDRISSSMQESKFLRGIPQGSKPHSLFVHSQVVESVRKYIKKI